MGEGSGTTRMTPDSFQKKYGYPMWDESMLEPLEKQLHQLHEPILGDALRWEDAEDADKRYESEAILVAIPPAPHRRGMYHIMRSDCLSRVDGGKRYHTLTDAMYVSAPTLEEIKQIAEDDFKKARERTKTLYLRIFKDHGRQFISNVEVPMTENMSDQLIALIAHVPKENRKSAIAEFKEHCKEKISEYAEALQKAEEAEDDSP
jgi:hypothetical protein